MFVRIRLYLMNDRLLPSLLEKEKELKDSILPSSLFMGHVVGVWNVLNLYCYNGLDHFPINKRGD